MRDDNPPADRVTDEDAKVQEYSGTVDPYSVPGPKDLSEYGPFKVVCEREAKKQFPDRTLIVRPSYIAGPGDDPNQAFSYWLARMEKGGEVLASGDPSLPVQFIDVRDLANWNISMIERRTTGIYNAAGPERPTTLGQMVDAAWGVRCRTCSIAILRTGERWFGDHRPERGGDLNSMGALQSYGARIRWSAPNTCSP